MIDFHIHSNTSTDTKNEVGEIIRTAANKGLQHICITNHYEPLEVKKGFMKQSFSQEELQRCRDQIASVDYPGLEVSLGVELSYTQAEEEDIQKFLEKNEFDYVLGTIHYVSNMPISNWGNRGKFPPEAIDEYFDSLKNAIKLEKFDMMAHLDIYKRCLEPYSLQELQNQWKEVAELLIKHNTGFEINTSRGFDEEGEFYPSRETVEFIINCGVKKITIGSDSHTYDRIGENYNMATQFLKSLGINEIYYFKERKSLTWKI